MSTLKKNVIANYIGQGWTTLMGLAFIPLYIKYLGIEAYGLIGIYAILQAWLALFDLGMTPTLSREMARFTGGAHDAQSIRDLLRSIEIIGIGIGILVALGIWAASGWLATDWLRVGKMPVKEVSQAFTIMGAVTAMRFMENIYRSSILGLQRQVLLNVTSSVMATLRGLGAVGILIWISPTIQSFFVWQCLISIMTVCLFAASVYSTLPKAQNPARFSLPALIGIRQFAASMMMLTFLAILLMQVDKILLSRMLTLKAFGYYALAGVVTNALYRLTGPITSAFYPRFTELVTSGNNTTLVVVYHNVAQLVSVLMGTAAIVLIVFGDVVMKLWTADPVLCSQVTPLVAVLALGTLLHGLMSPPYLIQYAHGWTSLAVRVNIFAVVIIVPAILWVTPKYGAIGAAWVWVALNTIYVTIVIHFMHQRLLTTEKWRWYLQDIAIPLTAAMATAVLLRLVIPSHDGFLTQLVCLLISAGLVLTAASLTAPFTRQLLFQYLSRSIKSICVRSV